MQSGTVIQNYILDRLIGEGGMGEVWLAKHKLLGREVAIKCLHRQLLRNESIRQRFKNEAALLARLQHPNIVALHDYIEQDGGAYLVMEYVDAIGLDEYVQKNTGPIPEPLLTQLFRQVLEGFIYAHEQQIVHRDIKPSNFLITNDQQVKILDFGIAKVLDSDHKLTKTGARMGTVLYMSPEQVRGEELDHRSDIYSLGVTLFQMATGRCPYDEHTTEFLVYDQIVNKPLPPAKDYYPGVSDRIEVIIRLATKKDREDRLQSCGEFLAAITKASAGSAAVSSPPTIVPPVPVPVPPPAVPQNTPPPVQPPAPAPEAPAPPPPTRKEKSKPPSQPVVEAAATMIAEPAVNSLVDAPPPATPKAPKNKNTRKRYMIFGGIGLMVAAAAAVLIIMSLGGGPKEKLYVIASNLFIRSAPNLNSTKGAMLPYGKAVEVRGKPNSDWVQIEYQGKKGYLARTYLVPEKDFVQLDAICSNPEANEMLRGSYQKFSLRDYFIKNNYRFDVSPEMYKKMYAEDKNNSRIWHIVGLSGTPALNTVIMGMKLEKPKYGKKENENTVVVIQNKGDPAQRRLVAFRHLDDGVNTEIGSMDLSRYPEHYIRSVKLADLKGYNTGSGNAVAIRRALSKGKEAILLSQLGNPTKVQLLVWNGYGDFKKYEMTKRYYW